MTTLAQLVERTAAHFPTNEPVNLGHWATALIRELETVTVMPDPLTNGTPATGEQATTDQLKADLAEPFLSLAELKDAAGDALAAVMARVAGRDVDPMLRSEAGQLVAVAMDWGRTAFALVRLDDTNDATALARAIISWQQPLEPDEVDIAAARAVIARLIDGSRAQTTTAAN